jgi:hypothetical protein
MVVVVEGSHVTTREGRLHFPRKNRFFVNLPARSEPSLRRQANSARV